MDGEYLLTVNVPAGETRTVPVPDVGISGVYSTAAIPLKWDFNGTIGDLLTTDTWEPFGGFHPRRTSYLILDNSAGSSAVDVSIRVSAA